MIIDYGVSIVGKSHIKTERTCQDSHYIKKMKNGWYIAAVADGVGSAKNSQIGSAIAAKTVVEFCDKCMPWDYNLISIKSMMRTAYNYAFKCILEESLRSGEPIESYDTTLSMVIFDGQRIVYGHSGDGAIIGLTTFGDYVEISRPQKSDDGISVIPLRAGYTQWVIDAYEEDLVAVLLMTDGMLETLCHYLLRNHEKKANRVYVPLASYFADPNGFQEENIQAAREEISDFVSASETYNVDMFYNRLLKIYEKHLPHKFKEIVEELKKNNFPVSLMQAEQDDKTIVGLINLDSVLDNKDETFYAEPNWAELQEAWNRKAYPHLYAELPGEHNNIDEKNEMSKIADTSVPEREVNEDNDLSREESSKQEDHSPVSVEDTQNTDGIDDALHILEKRSAQKDTAIKIDQKAAQEKAEIDTSKVSSTASEALLPTRPKHERPRKKGLLGKLEDFFD